MCNKVIIERKKMFEAMGESREDNKVYDMLFHYLSYSILN